MKKLKRSKEYREAFIASQIDVAIPFKIRALRKKRGMDQKDLAQATGMAQPRISAIESPGYSSYTIDTLTRIASAFDVALVVDFCAFSDLLKKSSDFSPDNFDVVSIDDDVTEATDVQTATANNVVNIVSAGYGVVSGGTKIWVPERDPKTPAPAPGTIPSKHSAIAGYKPTVGAKL